MKEVSAEPADDATLVGRCVDGDEAAWSVLVRRHGPVVFTIARRAGLSEDDAADVYQTTWRIAVESLQRLRDPARFSSWIARTAHFQSMRAIRSMCATRRAYECIVPAVVDDASADRAVAAAESRRVVADAMSRIGERCAALLRALYYDDPTPEYADIARRFAMPIGSIGPTRARCLTKLKVHLGRNGDDGTI